MTMAGSRVVLADDDVLLREGIARVLLHEVISLLKVDYAAIALISEDGKEATGLYARGTEADADWWSSVTIDLENEPSAVASASRTAGTPSTQRELKPRSRRSSVFMIRAPTYPPPNRRR